MPIVQHDSPIPCFLNSSAGNADIVAESVNADRRFQLHVCEPSQLVDAVRAAVSDGVNRIVVAGGDGTIAAAAGVMATKRVELGLIPAGTLNHFARRVGIPTNLKKAMDVAAECPARAVNVGYVNERLFLNSSSLGVYVDFVHARDKWKPRLGYYGGSLVAFFQSLARLPVYTIYAELEGHRRKFHTPLLFVGVDERGLKLPALGDPVDGGRSGLHVLVLTGESRGRVLRVALDAAVRGIRMVSRTPYLESLVVEMCTIELPHSRSYVAADGETLRMRMPLRYRIGRSDLMVAAPDPGEAVKTA